MLRKIYFVVVLVVLITSLGSCAPPPPPKHYSITDLGSLGLGSEAFATNTSGKVVGSSEIAIGINHTFLWQNNVMTDLGTLGNGTFSTFICMVCSEGKSINDSDQVVGWSGTTPGFGGHDRAFLWQIGKMTDLGTLGGMDAIAYSINNSGQVVGESTLAGGKTFHAFLYSGGTMIDLGTLGGTYSIAYGINLSGSPEVVGSSGLTGNMAAHAFLYSSGKMSDLGTLGGDVSTAHAVNASGQVVGESTTDKTGSVDRAFIWHNGVMSNLGSLGGKVSIAYSINASGQVIGLSWTGKFDPTGSPISHPFVYTGGAMYDLNNLIPSNSGWTLLTAYGINDAGQIVGNGLINGELHGFLLTPQES